MSKREGVRNGPTDEGCTNCKNRLEAEIDRLAAENTRQKEVIEYWVTMDKQATKGILALEAELADARKKPEPTEFTTKDKEEIAKKIHHIYFPTCGDCSYIDKDWLVVKNVIMPIIDRLTAEAKANLEGARNEI